MNYEKLLNQLSTQYSIVDVVDLSTELAQKNLLTILAKYDNKVFQDEERLVFLLSKEAPATFEQQGPDILPLLQMSIRDYNIPHFFVIILSNVDNLQLYLDKIHKIRYYQESMPIKAIYVA